MRELRKKHKHFRLLAAFLCVTLLLSGMNGLALTEMQDAGSTSDGLCPHHQQHDETCSYDEEAGYSCQFRCPLCVTDWKWVDDENLLEWDEETGTWGLGLPGASEDDPLTRDTLNGFLPAAATVETAADSQTVELSWDYGDFPESASSGTYTLTASLTDAEEGEYVLASGVPELKVLLDLGGGETYADKAKFLNQWSFITEKGTKFLENSINVGIRDLSSKNQADIIEYLKNNILPAKIRGWVSTNDPNNVFEKVDFTFDEDQSEERLVTTETGLDKYPSSGTGWGRVNIQWNMDSVPAQITDNTTFTIRAYIPTVTEGSDTYNIYVNSNDPADFKHKGADGQPDMKDTRTNPGILSLTVTINDLDPSKHTVTPASPDGTKINLFDYWVDTDGAEGNDLLGTNDTHINASGTDVPRTGVNDWNKGINTGHLLLFGDGNIHAGLWNKGAGAGSKYGQDHAGTMGIVKPKLENGYPVINTGENNSVLDDLLEGYQGISDWQLCGDCDGSTGRTPTGVKNISDTVQTQWNKEASLDYLFTPVEDNNKRAYEDVKGLFQIDKEGYYYYDMRQNFAEYDKDNNKFTLYDAPAVQRTDNAYKNGGFGSERSVGNFLPFNTVEQVFDGIQDGKLYSSERIQTHNGKTQGTYLNHHLGMTVDINFRQPEDGKINMGANGKQPMQFLFSGDDDVWVYIDDVLVLDLGGIHSEIYGVIDFSTGEISIGQSWKTNGFPKTEDGKIDINRMQNDKDICKYSTTIAKQFEKAGVEWTGSGDTFTGNTNHTLKMFFLERGNYDSSLAVRFNLQPQLSQQIKKVDQDGEPMKEVEFELYPADKLDNSVAGAVECLYTDGSADLNNKKFYVKQSGSDVLAHLKTGDDGVAQFLDASDNSTLFNFAQRGEGYYILKETKTPDGYRSLPVDIALYYDPDTGMISVANRWTTGAYACSVSNIIGVGKLTYGKFVDREIGVGDQEVTAAKQEKGLIVAIPMLLHRATGRWEALYGSNMKGFEAVMPENSEVKAWREAALAAALHQAADGNNAGWYLSWDGANRRLLGYLDDLPGLASRYRLNNPDGDMRMIYGIIEPAALEAVLGTEEYTKCDTAKKRYAALREYLKNHTVEDTVGTIMGVNVSGTASGKGFSFLNVDQFNRNFRSLVYIPNDQRELVVQKVDQDGKPLADAEFTLYNEDGTTPVTNEDGSVVSGTTDQNGVLVFSPTGKNDGTAGQAKMVWAGSTNTHYILKETQAPGDLGDYNLNNTKIPIVVGIYSIYADAGEPGDGVSVMAGVGQLTQTMRQYAKDNHVDITLQDITAFMQTQSSDDFNLTGWKDSVLSGTKVPRSMNLHFGMNCPDSYNIDYGLHDVDITGSIGDGQSATTTVLPVFVSDTGFVRARVQQNFEPTYDNTSTTNKDNLGDTDLTSLFSLLNVVVVTDNKQSDPSDPSTDTGKLKISKTITGGSGNLADSDYTTDFKFTLNLRDAGNNPLNGSYNYHFWGNDKAGTIGNGGTITLHHDDSIVIEGLPAGTRYTVTEAAPGGWHVNPASGTISGSIIKDQTAEASFTNSKDSTPVYPVDPPKDPDDPENPPEDPENPPEDPENPPEDPDDPKNPPEKPENPPEKPEKLPDPNDPDSPDEITIWEDGVPKTYVKVWDPEKGEWTYIPEEEVPKWKGEPQTGDGSRTALWAVLAAASLCGLAVLNRRKRKQ